MLNVSTDCEHGSTLNKIFILEIRIFGEIYGENGLSSLILDMQTNEPVERQLLAPNDIASRLHRSSCPKLIVSFVSDGQSDVEVELIAKKYVERGSSVGLFCKHNVEPQKIYKVTWLKNGNKVFEYINGRQPPYRNFSVAGAEIDVRDKVKLLLA
jgi:hypothetical protein